MDAEKLLEDEQMVYANCTVTNGSVLKPFKVAGVTLAPSNDPVDENDLTEAFQTFFKSVGDSVYGGGEGAAHGSCGFFYKKTAGHLVWLLATIEHGPFVDVSISGSEAAFINTRGDKWIITGDDLSGCRIEQGRT